MERPQEHYPGCWSNVNDPVCCHRSISAIDLAALDRRAVNLALTTSMKALGSSEVVGHHTRGLSKRWGAPHSGWHRRGNTGYKRAIHRPPEIAETVERVFPGADQGALISLPEPTE